mgnify:CR=1 FL=1
MQFTSKAIGELGTINGPRCCKRDAVRLIKELYGIDNFTDMIGDETIAEDPETLVAFLTEKGHPALGMDPMM